VVIKGKEGDQKKLGPLEEKPVYNSEIKNETEKKGAPDRRNLILHQDEEKKNKYRASSEDSQCNPATVERAEKGIFRPETQWVTIRA